MLFSESEAVSLGALMGGREADSSECEEGNLIHYGINFQESLL